MRARKTILVLLLVAVVLGAALGLSMPHDLDFSLAAPPTATPAATEAPQSKLDEIRARGVLRVGTTGDYQPMSFLNEETGEYEGFDIELAKALAEALDVELEFVPTTWPTLMEDTLA